MSRSSDNLGERRPYARETGAVVFPHTSATQQGTDWRDNDNDSSVEPMVEIYQGYDANYEEPNAPRAWKPGHTQSHQAQRPAGYVWNAWAKGYKLGVQSSSDHIATHTSYACVLTEQFTRQSILDAIRKRHTYAATDNIIVDFRIGDALMGDITQASTPPKLAVHIIGTAPIAQIDVIKNSQYIHQLKPGANDAAFEYLDKAIQPSSIPQSPCARRLATKKPIIPLLIGGAVEPGADQLPKSCSIRPRLRRRRVASDRRMPELSRS